MKKTAYQLKKEKLQKKAVQDFLYQTIKRQIVDNQINKIDNEVKCPREGLNVLIEMGYIPEDIENRGIYFMGQRLILY